VNLKELARSLELKEEELSELLDLFLKTTPSELIELQSALKEKDAQASERMAHSIKGAAGILGLLEIHDAAKKIETAARTNRLEEIKADLWIIKEKLEMIAEALKRGS
jgi:HPt (histidine-containing phosphotransfer) domain-containing protein